MYLIRYTLVKRHLHRRRERPARSNPADRTLVADAAQPRPLPAIEPALAFVAHKIHTRMPTVIKSEAFAEWIDNLRDRARVAQVLRRLARLEHGNPGRVAPVG